MKLIDNWLNGITMYRLVLYFLLFLVGMAFILSFFCLMPFGPVELVISGTVINLVSMETNDIFAKAFKIHSNIESVYITALILTLIIAPVRVGNVAGFIFLIWVSVLAMASKYIIAINKKHLFNPAAFAVALTAFTINQSASWWVGGNIPLIAFV